MITSLTACPSGQVAMGKHLRETKEKTRNNVGDMGIYWDLHTGSPGMTNWTRWREAAYMGTIYMGTQTTYMPGVRGQRLHVFLVEIILMQPAP